MVKKFWTITQRGEIESVCTRYHIPQKVEEEIFRTIRILDENYGVGRDINADGGFVALIIPMLGKGKEVYRKILNEYHLKEYEMEFSDEIENEEGWNSDLYIATNDFGITILYKEDC